MLARRSLAAVATALLAGQAIFAAEPPAAARVGYDSITQAALKAHLMVLASEAMQGREAATPQLDIAADYAASVFTLAGVQPAGDMIGREPNRERTYFQPFEVLEVTPKSQALSIETREGDTTTRRSYESGVDFTVNGTSSSQLSAPVVFAGYGLKVKDANWDDYAGLDVKGKIVLCLDGAPGEGKADSWFYKQENRRRYFGGFASIYKAMAAAEAGAAAVFVVRAPKSERAPFARDLAENKPTRDSSFAKNVKNLPARREMVLAVEDAGVALHGGFGGVTTVKISDRIGAELVGGSGKTLAELQSAIDAGMKPIPHRLTDKRASLDISVDSKVLSTRNVIGVIPGSDPALKDEVVMIGAHYDHDGARGGYVWYGADDNGSGTSAVLEIARAFAANPVKPKRTVMFALWSAEEKGLLGSKYFVSSALFPKDKVVTYINLDMIGRDGDPASGGDPHGATAMAKPKDAAAPKLDAANWMSVEGSDVFPELQKVTEGMNETVGLSLTYKASDMKFGASDHLYFARSGVPVISYFDGGHDDYHQPTDTIEKINLPKMEKVARLSYLTMWELAGAPARPKKVEPAKAAAK